LKLPQNTEIISKSFPNNSISHVTMVLATMWNLLSDSYKHVNLFNTFMSTPKPNCLHIAYCEQHAYLLSQSAFHFPMTYGTIPMTCVLIG